MVQALQPHPDLPGAVTFHQLEVLAQAVVGAEADFEDLDGAAVHSEVRLRAGITLSWTGNLPGQGVARHHLIHGSGLAWHHHTRILQSEDRRGAGVSGGHCCSSAAGKQRNVANTNI